MPENIPAGFRDDGRPDVPELEDVEAELEREYDRADFEREIDL